MKPVKTHLIKINVVLYNVFVAKIKMDPDSKHFENWTDILGPSTSKIHYIFQFYIKSNFLNR